MQSDDGTTYMMRLVTYLPGIPLAKYSPQTEALFFVLGQMIGVMDEKLATFKHPAMHRDLPWDLKNAEKTISDHLEHVIDPERRALAENFLQLFKTIEPKLTNLRQSLIHNDANDYNILVESRGFNDWALNIIDFGDLVYTHTINELAICAAYMMLNTPDPIAAILPLIGGYFVDTINDKPSFLEKEIEVLYPLICARLCVSGIMSIYEHKLNPENDYLILSQKPVWDTLQRLKDVNPRFAHYTFRAACGLSPNPDSLRVTDWLKDNPTAFAPIVDADLTIAPVFDLSVGSHLTGQLTQATADRNVDDAVEIFTKILFDQIKSAGATAGIGRYGEARVLYAGDQFEKRFQQELPHQVDFHSSEFLHHKTLDSLFQTFRHMPSCDDPT